MKKIFLFICFTFISLPGIRAQENINFGIKGGVNFSRLNFEEHNSRNRMAYHFGILSEIPVKEKFAIQPEILYSSQGTEAEIPSFEGPIHYDIKLDYLQVPLTIKYYILQNLALEAGPSFNFLLNEQITGTYSMFPQGETYTNKYGEFFEFGGLLGLSYKLPGNFFLNTRFTYGLTDAFKENGFSTNSIHNYGFQVGTGYMF